MRDKEKRKASEWARGIFLQHSSKHCQSTYNYESYISPLWEPEMSLYHLHSFPRTL